MKSALNWIGRTGGSQSCDWSNLAEAPALAVHLGSSARPKLDFLALTGESAITAKPSSSNFWRPPPQEIRAGDLYALDLFPTRGVCLADTCRTYAPDNRPACNSVPGKSCKARCRPRKKRSSLTLQPKVRIRLLRISWMRTKPRSSNIASKARYNCRFLRVCVLNPGN